MKRLILLITIISVAATALACTGRNAAAPDAHAAPRQAFEQESMEQSSPHDEDIGSAGVIATVPLPAGHPDISHMFAEHADGAHADNGMALPAGHPDINSMMRSRAASAADTPPAATQAWDPQGVAIAAPAAADAGHADDCPTCPSHPAPAGAAAVAHGEAIAEGTLRVAVVQGTDGGPAISGGEAVIELRQQDHLLGKMEILLDANGRVVIEQLPVHLSFQPVVKMVYEGVEYQVTGQVMGPKQPSQQLELVVFETTEQRPQWLVRMRHVMVQANGDRLQISEIVSVENPTDRTWIGDTTFTLPLPAGIEEVHVLSGFHACCVKFDGTQLVNGMAMLPGQSQYQLLYFLPINGKAAELTVAADVPTRSVAVFIPDDGSTAAAEGLEAMGRSEVSGAAPVRYFRAGGVPAGEVLRLSLSDLRPAAQAAAAASTHNARVFAGIGMLLILLFGGAFLFARSGKKAVASSVV